MDKVRGGTPRGNSTDSMCFSCRNAMVVKGVNNQELILCRASGGAIPIRFPVVDCLTYDNKAHPPLHEMQNIAWVVKSRNRGPMGFTEDAKTVITVEPPDNQNIPATQGPGITGEKTW